MKEISRTIFLCLKAQNKSEASYIKCYPKLKDLALEQYGNTPLEKAAFTFHYFFIDNDDSNYLAPIEVIRGVLLYLKQKGFKLADIENLYTKLKNAFQAKRSVKDIELILQNHATYYNYPP